jgi:hypothetical protein
MNARTSVWIIADLASRGCGSPPSLATRPTCSLKIEFRFLKRQFNGAWGPVRLSAGRRSRNDQTTGGTHETLSWCRGRCCFVGWHDGGCDGCPRRWTWWRWRRPLRWRPHGRWVPRALAGKRPFDPTTDLQSIDSIHCAFIARDPRLAGKSGVGIWQWLKRCANSVAL